MCIVPTICSLGIIFQRAIHSMGYNCSISVPLGRFLHDMEFAMQHNQRHPNCAPQTFSAFQHAIRNTSQTYKYIFCICGLKGRTHCTSISSANAFYFSARTRPNTTHLSLFHFHPLLALAAAKFSETHPSMLDIPSNDI